MTRKRPDFYYRVELVIHCINGHRLIRFHRVTIPERDDGVNYDAKSVGRFVRLTTTGYSGREWNRIHLDCLTPIGPDGRHCRTETEISTDRVEAELAEMWKPHAHEVRHAVWDDRMRDSIV